MSSTTSQDFYLALTAGFNAAANAIKLATDKDCRIVVWGPGYQKDSEIQITNGYGEPEIKVAGKDLFQCVEEFIRRVGFATQQANLQIGPPSIDQ